MIFVTGDTHGYHDFDKLSVFAKEHEGLTRDDYVIIAGDFGGVWNVASLDESLRLYRELPFTVLFVDGNHENFDLLNAYPVSSWNGGKVHKIEDNIIHLMRGQVFDICGKSIFTFGGATSIDKAWRVEGISWWRQEVPSDAEIIEANRNLEKYAFTVDFIITHSCDEKALFLPPLVEMEFQRGLFPENSILSYFEQEVRYKHWYFGHYHIDGDINEKKSALFHSIIRIDDLI